MQQLEQNETLIYSLSFCEYTDLTFFSMAKTLFQKIIDREIPAKIEYEDSLCIVIHDIEPQAPVHLLVIPKKLIARVAVAEESDQALLGHLLITVTALAKKLNLEQGFRVIINNGPHACESVPHMHIHVLAKRQMTWPPG